MQATLPKLLHYIWFGKGQFTSLNRDCMATWDGGLPGFEVVRWDEKHLPAVPDGPCSAYLDMALSKGEWSNASNLVRFLVMDQIGGVYFDTDVEVIRDPSSGFGEHELEIGWEDAYWTNGAIMVGKPGSWLPRACLDLFGTNVDFTGLEPSDPSNTKLHILLDGTELSKYSCPWIFTKLLLENGAARTNTTQTVKDVKVWRTDRFYPVPWKHRTHQGLLREVKNNKNVHTLHRWHGSWLPEKLQVKYVVV